MAEQSAETFIRKITPANVRRALIPPLEKAVPLTPKHEEILESLVGGEAMGRIRGLGAPISLCHDRYGHKIYAIAYRDWVFAIGTSLKELPEPSGGDTGGAVTVDFLLTRDFEKLQKVPRLVNVITGDNAYLSQRKKEQSQASAFDFFRKLGAIVLSIGHTREVVLHPSDAQRERMYRSYFNRHPEAKLE